MLGVVKVQQLVGLINEIMNVKSWIVLKWNHWYWTNYKWKAWCGKKPQLAFWCNWLWKVLRLCDMSSLQDMSSLLFIGIGMTGPNT